MKKNKGIIILILFFISSIAFINSTETLAFTSTIRQSLAEKNIQSNSEVWEKNGAVSFLELKSKDFLEENVNAEVLNNLEIDLKEKFLSQMLNGRRRRYTVDGRSCAGAFVQNGHTYYDCTNSRSPDGLVKNKEWCYVNPGEKGKNWDYCKPVMNYDKVRESNQKLLRELTVECRKVHYEIENHLSPAENAINELKSARDGQADIDNKINIMVRDVETINNKLFNLFSIKSSWEKEEIRVLGQFTI